MWNYFWMDGMRSNDAGDARIAEKLEKYLNGRRKDEERGILWKT